MTRKPPPIPHQRLAAPDLAALQLRLVRAEARARASDAAMRCLLALMATSQPEAFRLIADGLTTFADGLGERNAGDAYNRALVTELRGVIGDMLQAAGPVLN